jgi:hypothetical protein
MANQLQLNDRLTSKDLYKNQTGKYSYKIATKSFFNLLADKILHAVLKVWNGSSWVNGKPKKYWNGSSWIVKPMKIWNGTSWITIT